MYDVAADSVVFSFCELPAFGGHSLHMQRTVPPLQRQFRKRKRGKGSRANQTIRNPHPQHTATHIRIKHTTSLKLNTLFSL